LVGGRKAATTVATVARARIAKKSLKRLDFVMFIPSGIGGTKILEPDSLCRPHQNATQNSRTPFRQVDISRPAGAEKKKKKRVFL
jgi:hypothetical protein